ncbi:MarR family winged helix-turn-helix transcriptional regulator [Sphingomonas sp. LaA6.9]|uniref:MarR family winged helix-turn-helix transcriptional regulator n=1 Tax=Sphingomonas sp. LaA6.9 TaxID=2919914 RepID=UPI001F4FD864|nr:MarR family transcriptional regulator [Sphingomonas sp. LaA6.9]MCJ8156849.1 MarR family transcriptional regulator [Sphingomonas sp. LaA6.9]
MRPGRHRSADGSGCATPQAHDLTDPQWRVLTIPSAVDEIDLSELANRSMLPGPRLSRILKDLEALKLMTRRTCEKDGRRFLASITGEGRSLIATVSPELNPFSSSCPAPQSATPKDLGLRNTRR